MLVAPENTAGRTGDSEIDHQEHQAPEVYVARASSGGIAGSTDPSCVAGSGSGSKSGGDFPLSFGECTVVQVVEGPELVVRGLKVLVYNLCCEAVPPNALVLIERDKYGVWFTKPCGGIVPGSGSGSGSYGSGPGSESGPGSGVPGSGSVGNNCFTAVVGGTFVDCVLTLQTKTFCIDFDARTVTEQP